MNIENKISCQNDFCVYSEKLEGERVPTQSFRVLRLVEVREKELEYRGDINGDGITDRFIGTFPNLKGPGLGQIEFGTSQGGWRKELPADFKNTSGDFLRKGQDILVQKPYGSSTENHRISGFKLYASNPLLTSQPEIMFVGVEVLVDAGVNYGFNIDQCEKK